VARPMGNCTGVVISFDSGVGIGSGIRGGGTIRMVVLGTPSARAALGAIVGMRTVAGCEAEISPDTATGFDAGIEVAPALSTC
jgi:hypothetical protein